MKGSMNTYTNIWIFYANVECHGLPILCSYKLIREATLLFDFLRQKVILDEKG